MAPLKQQQLSSELTLAQVIAVAAGGALRAGAARHSRTQARVAQVNNEIWNMGCGRCCSGWGKHALLNPQDKGSRQTWTRGVAGCRCGLPRPPACIRRSLATAGVMNDFEVCWQLRYDACRKATRDLNTTCASFAGTGQSPGSGQRWRRQDQPHQALLQVHGQSMKPCTVYSLRRHS